MHEGNFFSLWKFTSVSIRDKQCSDVRVGVRVHDDASEGYLKWGRTPGYGHGQLQRS